MQAELPYPTAEDLECAKEIFEMILEKGFITKLQKETLKKKPILQESLLVVMADYCYDYENGVEVARKVVVIALKSLGYYI